MKFVTLAQFFIVYYLSLPGASTIVNAFQTVTTKPLSLSTNHHLRFTNKHDGKSIIYHRQQQPCMSLYSSSKGVQSIRGKIGNKFGATIINTPIIQVSSYFMKFFIRFD